MKIIWDESFSIVTTTTTIAAAAATTAKIVAINKNNDNLALSRFFFLIEFSAPVFRLLFGF